MIVVLRTSKLALIFCFISSSQNLIFSLPLAQTSISRLSADIKSWYNYFFYSINAQKQNNHLSGVMESCHMDLSMCFSFLPSDSVPKASTKETGKSSRRGRPFVLNIRDTSGGKKGRWLVIQKGRVCSPTLLYLKDRPWPL